MASIDTLRKLALSFPETTEEPHFEKIFATYDEKNNRACLKFSEVDQDVFSAIDKTAIYPVPNKWGKQGWTFVELDKINDTVIMDALTTAYCEVAPKKLAEKIRLKDIDI